MTYAELAKPISTLLMGLAMVIVFCGNMRFWRQQDAIIRGKIFTASWEPIVVGIIMLVVRRNPAFKVRISEMAPLTKLGCYWFTCCGVDCQ